MRHKTTVFAALAALLLPGYSSAIEKGKLDIVSFQIFHAAPKELDRGKDFVVNANIGPADKVKDAAVNIRAGGQEQFRQFKMRNTGRDKFTVRISGTEIQGESLEYYIIVRDIYNEDHFVFRDSKSPQKVPIKGEEVKSQVQKPMESGKMEGLQDEFALFAAEDVVFAASKHEQKVSEAPSAVSIITAENIKNSGAISIAEVLRRVPGMEVYFMNPSYPIVGARGFANEANDLVVVLINNREVNSQLLGSTFWELLPVSMDDIERIEVIRGPGSALYGANAFSGVINIVTKSPEASKGMYVKGHGGVMAPSQKPLYGGNTNYSLKTEDFGMSIAAGYKDRPFYEKGWKEKSSLNSVYGRLLAEYTFAESGKVTVEGGASSGDLYYFMPLSPVQIGETAAFGKANLKYKWIENQLSINNSALNFKWVDKTLQDATSKTGIPINTMTIDELLQLDVDAGKWSHLNLGGNLRINTFTSNYFEATGIRSAFASGKGSQSFSEMGIGPYLQDEIRPLDWLILNGGFRYDYNSVMNEKTIMKIRGSMSPRGTIILVPAENHSIRLSAAGAPPDWKDLYTAGAFRKPSYLEYGMHLKFNHLNNSGGIGQDAKLPIGNSELANYTEKMSSYEVGYNGRLGPVKLNTAVFYNLFVNKIDFDFNNPEGMNYNNFKSGQSNSDEIGGEFGTDIFITEWMSMYGNFAYQKISPIDDIYPLKATAGVDPIFRKGETLKFSPTFKGGGGLNFKFVKSLLINLSASYFSAWEVKSFADTRSGWAMDGENLRVATLKPKKVPANTILNANVSYTFFTDVLEVGAYGNNLLCFSKGLRQYPGLPDVAGELNANSMPWVSGGKVYPFGGEKIGALVMGYLKLKAF